MQNLFLYNPESVKTFWGLTQYFTVTTLLHDIQEGFQSDHWVLDCASFITWNKSLVWFFMPERVVQNKTFWKHETTLSQMYNKVQTYSENCQFKIFFKIHLL